jgi:hypothetical protein
MLRWAVARVVTGRSPGGHRALSARAGNMAKKGEVNGGKKCWVAYLQQSYMLNMSK